MDGPATTDLTFLPTAHADAGVYTVRETLWADSAFSTDGTLATIISYDSEGASGPFIFTPIPDLPPQYDLVIRDASGSTITIDFLTDVTLTPPAIAAFGNNTFIAAATSEPSDPTGPGGPSGSIYAYIFDTAGTILSQFAIGSPAGYAIQPDIAIMADGNAFVTWQRSEANGVDIFGQIFTPDGTATTGVFTVNAGATAGTQLNPHVTALAANQVLVVWEDASTGTLVGQVIDYAGAAASNLLTIAPNAADIDTDSIVTTVLTDGRVVLGYNLDAGGAFTAIIDPRPDVIYGNGVIIGRDVGALNDTIIGGDGADTIFGLGGVDALYGAGGNDVIYGGEGNDTALGGDGNDFINGQNGIDFLYGEAGSDTILGGDGGDIIYGNADQDFLYGEGGNDTLVAGSGNDFAYGGAGVDVLYGEGGTDYLLGGDGNDFILGQDGTDVLYGEMGQDTIYGGTGDDVIYGGSETDSLYGEAGTDTILGGDSADFIFGGADTDVIYGEAGNDVIYGGTGNDFIFTGAGFDVVFIEANGGIDQIFDFTDGEDAIAFVGGAGPSGMDDLTIVQSNGYTVIGYNPDGLGGYDNLIYLDNIMAVDLDANDFFFG